MRKGFIYRAMMFAFRIRAFFFAGLVLMAAGVALVRVGNDFDVRSGPGRLSFVLSQKGSRTGPDSSDYLRNCTRSLSSSVDLLPAKPPAARVPVLRVSRFPLSVPLRGSELSLSVSVTTPLSRHFKNRIAEPQQVVVRNCIVSLQFPRSEFSTVYSVDATRRLQAKPQPIGVSADAENKPFKTNGVDIILVISHYACVGDSGNRNPAFRIAQWRRAVLRFGPEVLPRPWHPVEGSPLFVSPFRRWPSDRLSNFPAHGGTVARRYQERKGQTLSDLRSANV
jgi:hypothetical protein